MADSSRFIKQRTRTTFIASLVIISLVLLVLGVFAFISLYVNVYLEEQQEEIAMIVVLPKDITAHEQDSVAKVFEQQEFAKSVTSISSEAAKADFIDQAGEDFVKIMGDDNPLHPTLEVKLNAGFITPESIKKIRKDFKRPNTMVEDVDYPIEDLEEIKRNVFLITVGSAGVVLLLIFIAFFIIRSTVRLAVYSKRLIIRSMQLIGATTGFIRRPFIGIGLLQGILGAIVADGVLTLVIMGIAKTRIFGGLDRTINSPEYMILCGGIVIFGALLGLLSSRNAVNRFLHKNLDELM